MQESSTNFPEESPEGSARAQPRLDLLINETSFNLRQEIVAMVD
jgi:hypothetical protein